MSFVFPGRVIAYSPEVSKKLGSVTAAILVGQLEFWFSKYKTFWKFLEPNNSENYREGDSWTEELAFSKAEFKTAFNKVGIKYASQKEYEDAENKFVKDGKEYLYCSYTNKMTHITWYERNDAKVEKFWIDTFFVDRSTLKERPFPSNELQDKKGTRPLTPVLGIRRDLPQSQSYFPESKKVDLDSYTDINAKKKNKYVKKDVVDKTQNKSEEKPEVQEVKSLSLVKTQEDKNVERLSVDQYKQVPPAPASCQGKDGLGLSNDYYTRPTHHIKKTSMSIATDAWMAESKQNVKASFAEWVYNERRKSNSNTNLVDIVAEIKNNADGAAIWWKQYLKYQEEQAKLEQLQQEKLKEKALAEAKEKQAQWEIEQEAESYGMTTQEYILYKNRKAKEDLKAKFNEWGS
jgi:hypothetical protein